MNSPQTKNRESVQEFCKSVTELSDIDRLSTEGTLDKHGIATGGKVINPFTGKAIPVS